MRKHFQDEARQEAIPMIAESKYNELQFSGFSVSEKINHAWKFYNQKCLKEK